jgi:3-hydroxyacyl-CoA dehydrogenase/enoyl-CoA hydratase/3-hydroxybutyryl-CoA epimerase/enoyl-CoA isomerase
VVARLQRQRNVAFDPVATAARLLYPMVDEVYRCLEEGIVGDEQDADLGLVMGIGFPPVRGGGPIGFGRTVGLKRVVGELDDLSRRVHPRFRPSDRLRRSALADG